MATVGRSSPIEVFLQSLQEQDIVGTGARINLIIVDQNEDDRVREVIESFDDLLPICVLASERGLSRARNIGLSKVEGDIVGFPDDDCWYSKGFLDGLVRWFAEHPEADGLSCRVTDEQGHHSAGGFMSKKPHWITKGTIWRSAVSPGLFVRKELIDRIGGFDEQLGVGAGTPWNSGEESDFVLRGLEAGGRFYYDPDRVVYHPRREMASSSGHITRAWSYGLGMGFVLRRHQYSFFVSVYYGLLMLGSALISLLRLAPGDALGRAAMGLGRWVGWCRAPRGQLTSIQSGMHTSEALAE
ncbi:MAG: glycosyltransferase [Planctomycetota bacterium]|nr:glycosyltransferase [Planctomycetota bacterium]